MRNSPHFPQGDGGEELVTTLIFLLLSLIVVGLALSVVFHG
jgi:hypothetical protein